MYKLKLVIENENCEVKSKRISFEKIPRLINLDIGTLPANIISVRITSSNGINIQGVRVFGFYLPE